MIAKIKLTFFNIFKKISELLIKTRIHRKLPFVVSIYNFLFQYLWPYKNIIEIQGSKMFINIKDESYAMRKTFEAYASNRIHEKATTELFKKIVQEGNIVVDLGANIGYFTLLAARLVGEKGKVFAFEPEPKNYSYLIRNIELNKYNNIVAFQKAVSSKSGKIKFFVCGYDSGHHTINQPEGIEAYRKGRSGETEEIEIEAVTLDIFLQDKTDKIDVIKMDVEGAEALALAGMNRILRINKKLKMFVEFFPLLIRKMGNSPEEFIRKFLEDYKFSIYVIPDDYDAKKGEMIRINSVKEIMNLYKGEEDHINSFLKRDGSNKINPEKR